MELGTILSPEFWHNALKILGVKSLALAKVLIFFAVIRFVAYRLINRILRSLSARETGESAEAARARIHTLGSLIRSMVFYTLIFISGVMVLRVFDVDPAPVLTAAGVVGLAVGFGAQRLVRDIISGFFIVLENQYCVGEYVTIGAITGTVEELGMRTTRIRDDVGKLTILSNGDITIVTNHSRGPLQATLEISVPSDSDLEKVRSVIDDAGREVANTTKGVVRAPTANGIIAMDASKITLRVSGEVKPGYQDVVQANLREVIKRKFEEAGIKLA
jgi:small conductance mechanosensitive channel